MIVIGLVGEKGSGKDTFAKYFEEVAEGKTVAHIRFSDLLKETLISWDIPLTRANLQKIAQVMEGGFGSGTVAHATLQNVQSTKADFVILDGVRWIPDVELIRKFPKNFLIYITADLDKRFQRLSKRGEKLNESTTSFEQFVKEEKAKNELLIPKIGSGADIKIENNGSFEEFKDKISDFYAKFVQSS